MTRQTSSVLPSWIALVVLLLGMTSAGSLSAQSTGELPIDIVVVQPSGGAPTPAGPEGANPYSPTAGTTITASLVHAAPMPVTTGMPRTALDLVVDDGRQVPGGWVVTVREATTRDEGDPNVLDAYLRRTQPLDGQPMVDGSRPHGVRVSIGQPLDRMTPVMAAPSGTGQGAYSIRFAISGGEPGGPTVFIVATVSAP